KDTYFPVTLDQCGAKIRYHDLVEGTFDIDDIKVSTHYLNHPALTLGYRLEADGVAVVYACDHEPHSRVLATGDGDITGQDLRHAEFVNRADLLIHDAQYTAEEYPAEMPIGPASAEGSVLRGTANTNMAAARSKTIRAEGIHAKFFSNMDEARTLIAKDRPSLAILEHDPPRIDGMEMCRAIRQQENDREHQVPVVMVAAQENQARGAEAGVTDWLIKPFNDAYARTKIRAWALRAACQWMRAVIPEDEERRLARPPMHVQRAPMAQKGTGRFSENVIRTDELIARATKRPSEMRNRSAAN